MSQRPSGVDPGTGRLVRSQCPLILLSSLGPNSRRCLTTIEYAVITGGAPGTGTQVRGYQDHSAGVTVCGNDACERREASVAIPQLDANIRNALTLGVESIASGAVKLDFAILPEGAVVQDFSVAANDLHLRTDTCIFDRAVRVCLTAYKTQDELVVEGRVSTEATATCVRCLDSFPLVLDEPFRVVANVVEDSEAGADTGDDDFFLLPASAPVLDLSDPVRELLILAVPDNPVCKTDCAGLCSGCGRNLNHESCVCPEESAEGPLAKLGALLNRSKRGNGSELG